MRSGPVRTNECNRELVSLICRGQVDRLGLRDEFRVENPDDLPPSSTPTIRSGWGVLLHRPVISGIARSGSPARLNSIVASQPSALCLTRNQRYARASGRLRTRTTAKLHASTRRHHVAGCISSLGRFSHSATAHAARATIATTRARAAIAPKHLPHVGWSHRMGGSGRLRERLRRRSHPRPTPESRGRVDCR
jgi:hypothetical protein